MISIALSLRVSVGNFVVTVILGLSPNVPVFPPPDVPPPPAPPPPGVFVIGFVLLLGVWFLSSFVCTTSSPFSVAFALPSKGAEITEVSYTINDSTFNYIYLKGGGIIEPKGTLGKGRVLLLPNENTIVFKVVDSSGKSATFTVKENPKFDYGIPTPGFGDDEKSDFADPSKGKFVNNRIIVYLKSNANKQRIQELVEYVDGTIIGKNNVVNKIVIKIPKKTEEEINALCEELETKYPDIVDHVSLETFGLIGPAIIN